MTMTISTALTERLGCRYPIISAGMGGPARALPRFPRQAASACSAWYGRHLP